MTIRHRGITSGCIKENTLMSSLNPHAALVYTMVIASAIDAEMTDVELLRIGQLVDRMPVFTDYEPDELTADAEACAEVLASDGGVDAQRALT